MLAGMALAAGSAPALGSTTSDLQAVVDRAVADHAAVAGATLAADVPRLGLAFRGAAGRLGPASLTPMAPDSPFRIASTTKPFTAAAVLRLYEQDRLSLDDTIDRYLPAELVDRISVIDGRSYGPTITLRQLLAHRAGIYSHDAGADYTAAVATQPTKRWTPEEQVQWAIDHGSPVCPPDQCWSYSDTGYVMLGMVIVKITGHDFGTALRELLPLDALGIAHTWHELLEPVPPGTAPRAHASFGPLDLDSWNPSFDSWGGGGLDAPAADLAAFVRALFAGKVFQHQKTLRLMSDMGPAGGVHKDGYGLGLGRQVIEGVECFGHPGFWSSTMVYCPSLDLAFAGSTNQAEDGSGPTDGDGHTQFDLENGTVRVVAAALATQPPARGPGPAVVSVPIGRIATVPSGRHCVGPRRIRLRLRAPHGQRLVAARILLNGRQVDVVHGRRLTAPLAIRIRPRRRLQLVIVAITDSGARLKGSRRYRSCAATTSHGRHAT